MIRLALVAFAMSLFVLRAADVSADPAVVLAQILSEKGTISAAELSRVQGADDHSRLTVLTGILQEKGLLNSGDLARLSMPGAGVSAQPVITAKSVTPTKPSSGTATTASAEVDTKKDLPVSLYGTLLWTAGYNTALYNFEDTPMVATKQATDPSGGDRNFYQTVRQSRIGLTLNPFSTLGGKLSGAFEFDMMGGQAPYPNGVGMNFFRMRLAYGRMEWDHVALEAGQDWTVFAPLNPTSLNQFGIPEFTSSGNAWIRSPQIRLEMKTKHPGENNLLWQLAAMDPNMGDMPASSIIVQRQPLIGERGRMPAIESRLAFSKSHNDRDYTVGLSARYGRGKNATTVTTATTSVTSYAPVDSWGVALDYSLPFSKSFNLTGELYDGRALGIYGVTLGEAIGAVGTAGQHGVHSRGGWAQAQLNFSKQWQMNLAYGIDAPQVNQLPVGNRSRNQQYMANIIDKLTKNINASLEYRRILTDFRNQLPGNERGDHVDVGIAYIF
jgi:hypothetical protein